MHAPALLSLTLLFLLGCSSQNREAGAAFDRAAVDRVPVVPVQTSDGNGTGLLLSDGTLLTCSHVLPRGEPRGRVRVTGPWIDYQVVASGDDVAQSWTQSTTNVRQDWAALSLLPPVDPKTLFDQPIEAAPATTPVRSEDRLFLVGYTVQGQEFIRCWVPLQVCDTGPFASLGSGEFGVRVIAGTNGRSEREPATKPDGRAVPRDRLSLGFSGAPVWRIREDGEVEVCGVLVAAQLDAAGTPTTMGIAIVPGPLTAAGVRDAATAPQH